jgi:hypothetical protein
MLTYVTAENTVFIPLKTGCLYKTTLCKIALGPFFLACLFVCRVGAALCFWLFTIKFQLKEKTKAMCRLWAGYKKHDRKTGRRGGRGEGL